MHPRGGSGTAARGCLGGQARGDGGLDYNGHEMEGDGNESTIVEE